MKWLAGLLALAGGFASAGALAADTDALFAARLRDMGGVDQALTSWQGKPLIVNFWARWCVPCRKEIPELARVREQHRQQGLEVIGIGLEENGEVVREFAKAYDMTYPILLAGDQGITLMRALGNSKAGLPFTLVVDRQGRIVQSKLGAMTGAELDRAAASLLQ